MISDSSPTMEPPSSSNRLQWSTPLGTLTVRSFRHPDEISAFRFPESFGRFARYHPIISDEKTLVRKASKTDTAITLALTSEQTIVGLAVLERPDPGERWSRVGEGLVLEVSVIEVDRDWRSHGVADRLLTLLLDLPSLEERILYMVGYSWTWDLDFRPKTAMQYRNMLMNLFARHGFSSLQTNEPNICLRPENLFMARIGDRVPEEARKKFKMVRFNLDLYQ